MAKNQASGAGVRTTAEPLETEGCSVQSSRSVLIPAGAVTLAGELTIPPRAVGVVLFAHGSGSSRNSPRNQFVAQAIQETGTGTLLFDLLTREEESLDASTGHLRFNIGLLARRLLAATRWIANQPVTKHLGIGYFGSSTGAAAALVTQQGGVQAPAVREGLRRDTRGHSFI